MVANITRATDWFKAAERRERPTTPSLYDQAVLDTLLAWAADEGASDVHIQSGEAVKMARDSDVLPITDRALSHAEVHRLTNAIIGDHATPVMGGPHDVNKAYHFTLGAGEKRFRVKATTCGGNAGIHIVLRVLPAAPPPLDVLDLPEVLEDALLDVPRGLVLITGPTGSGKSTLLAAVLQTIANRGNAVIPTLEDPIEYSLRSTDTSVVAQTALGIDIESWADGLQNVLRRAFTHLLIGEARDIETMAAVIEACLTGHPVYTTLHTPGVVETMARVAWLFRNANRASLMVDLISQLNVIASQILVAAEGGGRQAIREYLIIDDTDRVALYQTSLDKLPGAIRELLLAKGRSFSKDAAISLERHQISQSTFWEVTRLASYATA